MDGCRGKSLCVTTMAMFLVLAGCKASAPNLVQGYVEGEFVYVASPRSGRLENVYVQRGDRVKANDLLFSLDSDPERAASDGAKRRLAQGLASLEDAKKGRRPSEIESIEAQIGQARAALQFSEGELERQERLTRIDGGTSRQDFDRARSTRDSDRQRVAQLDADLRTAQLGSRPDQIVAAEANVRALASALAEAEWDLSQKRQTAPEAGLISDRLYHEGDWVEAGRPVIGLLPPRNIKVRAFVPETEIGAVHPGDAVRVFVDGVAEPFTGKVSFIAAGPEYTPPVIYSRESRAKLVFMVEAVFDAGTAARLHPGQPVDVQFGTRP
jgi:HlyD family secretion protein